MQRIFIINSQSFFQALHRLSAQILAVTNLIAEAAQKIWIRLNSGRFSLLVHLGIVVSQSSFELIPKALRLLNKEMISRTRAQLLDRSNQIKVLITLARLELGAYLGQKKQNHALLSCG
jgi:hypothetical protein